MIFQFYTKTEQTNERIDEGGFSRYELTTRALDCPNKLKMISLVNCLNSKDVRMAKKRDRNSVKVHFNSRKIRFVRSNDFLRKLGRSTLKITKTDIRVCSQISNRH